VNVSFTGYIKAFDTVYL